VRRVRQRANDSRQLFPIDKSQVVRNLFETGDLQALDLKGQYVLSSAFVEQVLDGLRGE
jgi:hypothetical protein